MNRNRKILIDTAMILGMIFSMSFHLLGTGTHKMIGLITCILFLIHNILNRHWYKGLSRQQHRPRPTVNTCVNFLMIIAIVGVMVSGVMLSRDLAIGLGNIMTTGRFLHNVSSYAGCIGIALHIGIHLKGRKCYDDR